MAVVANNGESVLFWLEPVNQLAVDVVLEQSPGRCAKAEVNGLPAKYIEVKLEEPRQPKGHVMFGRNSRCAIRFPKSQLSVSSFHCYVDINPTSGELVLCAIASQPTTWLDGDQIGVPRFQHDPLRTRAMVYQKSRRLQIAEAVFNVLWPQINRQRTDIYRRAKLFHVGKTRQPDDDDELTDFEFAMKLKSACYSLAPTRPTTRQITPSGAEVVVDRGPIRIKCLGSGAYGTVHLAVDRMNADYVAIKSFNQGQRVERDVEEAAAVAHQEFIRELMAMRQLNHVTWLYLIYKLC